MANDYKFQNYFSKDMHEELNREGFTPMALAAVEGREKV